MAFEPKKYSELFDDMRASTSVVTDFEVGSVARTIYESFAYELALLYEKMQLVYLSAFVDTARGQQLDQVVAVLGITRGEPDFAEGMIQFERDVGNEEIVIPIGTLVATEDTPESPKKAYQTIERATISGSENIRKVKIQAVERGEEWNTDANSIVVMPKPIPGIKSITNPEAVVLTGKRRETDEDLRERAKNALISSGKATILSIQNTLLSLPEVKDVKVQESFHFATGQVTVERTGGTEDILIPKSTLIKADVEGVEKSFKTLEKVLFLGASTSFTINVEAIREGRQGEIQDPSAATWSFDEEALNTDLKIKVEAPIELEDFGIIRVIVDGPEIDTDPGKKEEITQAIDEVRAAGIFVLLQRAEKIQLDAVFRVAFSSALNLTPEEHLEREQEVRSAIIRFFDQLRMGQSILFARLIKEVLSLEGLENMEDFSITTTEVIDGEERVHQYTLADKRIDLREIQRFNPRYLCVASEDKALPINIELQSTGIDAPKKEMLAEALKSYIAGLGRGAKVSQNDLAAEISGVAGINIVADTLRLKVAPWCERPMLVESDGDYLVDTSFVEIPELGDLFVYANFLEITGAVKLTLPPDLSNEEKSNIRQEILDIISQYLDNLAAEEDLVFAEVIAVVSNVNQVLAVDIQESDFSVKISGAPVPGRVTSEKIGISVFEKGVLENLCVTGDIETIVITVDKIELEANNSELGSEQVEELKNAVALASTNFLTGASPGEQFIFNTYRSALENLVPGLSYTITTLELTAESLCDDRIQTTDLSIQQDIHIRSVEIGVMESLNADDITVTTS